MKKKCDWCGSTENLREQGTERNKLETLCGPCGSQDGFDGFMAWARYAEAVRYSPDTHPSKRAW